MVAINSIWIIKSITTNRTTELIWLDTVIGLHSTVYNIIKLCLDYYYVYCVVLIEIWSAADPNFSVSYVSFHSVYSPEYVDDLLQVFLFRLRYCLWISLYVTSNRCCLFVLSYRIGSHNHCMSNSLSYVLLLQSFFLCRRYP